MKPNPRIGIITQARMTSTRLPGKILLKVNGKTMLDYHVDRLKKITSTNVHLAIATTVNSEDDVIEEFARQRKIPFFRGSEEDVLSRYYYLQQQEHYDIICRVTSDCPLIDPSLVQAGIEKYISLNSDQSYVSNCFPRTYARGFDYEVFSSKMLDETFHQSTAQEEREHVTPSMWKNKSNTYHLENLSQEENNGALRITIDTPEDFTLVKKLIEEYDADQLNYIEIEKILNAHPELVQMNAHIEQKKTQ